MARAPEGLRAVLFDLDGTLLDSFQSHLAIYQATLARFGIALAAADFRRHYTPDWNELYRRVGLRPEDWDAASAIWLRESDGHRPNPFPGAAEVLEHLSGRFRLGLVSAGSRSRVSADLDRGSISGYFDVVVTADDVRRPKPDPEGLRVALRSLGLEAREAVYVGDTEADYAFATAAGVRFVGVRSEFAPGDPHVPYARLPGIAKLPAYLGAGQGPVSGRKEPPASPGPGSQGVAGRVRGSPGRSPPG